MEQLVGVKNSIQDENSLKSCLKSLMFDFQEVACSHCSLFLLGLIFNLSKSKKQLLAQIFLQQKELEIFSTTQIYTHIVAEQKKKAVAALPY